MMMNDANWTLIPEHCRGGLRRYIERGTDVGDFLYAVLANDLRGAVRRADDTNMGHLADYVKFLYCYAPSQCWGSPAKVAAWMGEGGLYGQSKSAANPELAA